MSQSSLPDPANLEQQILTAIGERILEVPAGFDADSDLYAAGLDSMAMMQLVLLLEEKFGVVVPDSDICRANFQSVRQLARLVRERLAAVA